MKNNLYYTTSDKYLNPSIRYSENKFTNNNSGYNNMSFEVQSNSFKRNEPEPYPTLVSEPIKSNKNLKSTSINANNNQENYYPSFNKNSYRDYYETESYQPYEYGQYNDYDYQTNWNMRPFALYSQSIENKRNTEYRKNLSNFEDDIYQTNLSNHSYYESKYSKKKGESKNDIININKNNQNTISNISLSKNLNKSHVIPRNLNNRYEINKSPSTKNTNQSYLNKNQNNNNNSMANNIADNRIKKNMILNNSSIIRDNYFNQFNSKTLKSLLPPRTPSVYSHHKIHSPLKRLEDENYNKNSKNDIYYNKTERNLPSKSLEKVAFKKLVFNYQKNANTLKNNKNLDKEDNNKPNITSDPFKLKIAKIPATPKQFRIKNLTNIYKNVNDDKNLNTNITISIKNRNEEKNNTKNNYISTETNVKDNNKNNTEIQKDKKINDRKLSKEINENKEKTSSIKEIKVINTNKNNKKNISPKNDIVKTVVSKIKTNDINDKKINISNNKIPTKQTNYVKDSKYMKEKENLMNDNSTELSTQTRYTFNNYTNYDNSDISNKSLNIPNLARVRVETNKETKERKTQIPMTEFKTYKSDNIDVVNKFKKNNNNNNKNQIIHTISNISNTSNSNFDIDNKMKSQEIPPNKLRNNIINNSKITNIKKNNSKKNLGVIKVDEYIKTEQKTVSNISKNNILDSIPIKKLNQLEKLTNPIPKINSSLESLNINKTKKEKEKDKGKEERPHRYQSELSKYESRAREKSEKAIEKKEDEWDDIQYKGMRKTTYDPGRRSGKNKNTGNNKKNGSLKEQFHSTIYIKKSEGLTLAGKNEYGNKKTNQDTFVIEKNVNGVLNFNIFGVLDGHGDDGHFASQFVSRYVIYRIKNHPTIKKLDEPKEIYNKLIANGYEIIANIYLDADVQIQKEKFDVTRSGTTIVLVIQLEEHIICANTGDSRAIVIYDKSYEDNLANSKIFPLSYDCKPELPNEKKRIMECGGVVEKAYYSDDDDDDDEIPFRVWAKGEDYPGLAMSRSIGDMDAKKVGVIPNPQIVEYTIDYFSKYLLMGSDGIWEFISNEDAMKVANKFYLRNDAIGLCHELSDKSIKLWEEKDVVIDDITILVVFF